MPIRDEFRNLISLPAAVHHAPSHCIMRFGVTLSLAMLMAMLAAPGNADAPDDRAAPQIVQILEIEDFRIVGLSQGGTASDPAHSTLSVRILGTPRDGSQVTQARIYFIAPGENLRHPRYGSGLKWIEMTMPVETLPGVLAMLDQPHGFVRYREWSRHEREAEINAGTRP